MSSIFQTNWSPRVLYFVTALHVFYIGPDCVTISLRCFPLWMTQPHDESAWVQPTPIQTWRWVESGNHLRGADTAEACNLTVTNGWYQRQPQPACETSPALSEGVFSDPPPSWAHLYLVIQSQARLKTFSHTFRISIHLNQNSEVFFLESKLWK